MKEFTIIASTTKSFGIGKNGELPWKLAGDMAFFKHQTMTSIYNKQNAVIMGRKTWESLPIKSRPLVQRINVVISRNPLIREELNIPEKVIVANSLYSALTILSNKNDIDQIYIIGGETIYREAISSCLCSKILLTQIDTDISGLDTFFPVIPDVFKQNKISDIIVENDLKYRFTVYEK
jgi:dihydrofolate reductase